MGQKILSCNLCDSPDYKILWVENGINVVKCKNCGFTYSQTLPLTVFEKEDKAEDTFNQTERKRKIYSQVLKLLGAKSASGLLDIGCRTGNFMLCCKREDFQSIIGVEISGKFAEFTSELGFKVFNCRLEEAALPNQSFDIITYLETLEHISTPVCELMEAYRILKHDGIIVVEVPNLTFHLLKARVYRFFHIGPHSLMPHNHLVHFTDRTIREAMTRAGFKSVRTMPTAPVIEEGMPVFTKALRYLFYYLYRLVRLVSGLSIGNALIASAEKNTGANATDCD
jgi:uncharacterized metal-binding protein (TIGR02443 family)